MSEYYICPECDHLTDTRATGEQDGIVECNHCGKSFDSFYANSFDPQADVTTFQDIAQRSMEGDQSHPNDLAVLVGIARRALEREGRL